jgi:uncharacterized protein
VKFQPNPLNRQELPYVLPFVVWLIGVYLQSLAPSATLWAYPLRTIVVGALLIYFRKHFTEIKLSFDWTAILAGTLVFVLWVGLDPYLPKSGVSTPTWTPETLRSESESAFWVWIAFRIFGSTIVVAFMEELFWRSFLARWIINADFKKVPIGTFSLGSFVMTTILFGFEHHEWASGIIAGAIYMGLLYWRKNLFTCIVAHAITNFLLSLYVLKTSSWHFW